MCDVEPMMTPREVARTLGIHPSTVSRLVTAHRFLVEPVWITPDTYRFRRSDVAAVAGRVVTPEAID